MNTIAPYQRAVGRAFLLERSNHCVNYCRPSGNFRNPHAAPSALRNYSGLHNRNPRAAQGKAGICFSIYGYELVS